jgi:hypothetical protein
MVSPIISRDRSTIQETGFLQQFTPSHERLHGNPVSFARAIDRPSKKPGLCDNLSLLSEMIEETRFLNPPSNTLSTVNYQQSTINYQLTDYFNPRNACSAFCAPSLLPCWRKVSRDCRKASIASNLRSRDCKATPKL